MASAESAVSVQEQKFELRSALRAARPQSSSGLTDQLIGLVQAKESTRVGCYSALADEPDTMPFLNWTLTVPIAINTPTIVNGSLRWQRYLGELKPDKYGIGVSTGPEVNAGELDLIFVPALGATASGQRLGRGGGYFDRALADLRESDKQLAPIIAAIVFDSELLTSMPTEAHDQLVEFVVTPSKVIRTKTLPAK